MARLGCSTAKMFEPYLQRAGQHRRLRDAAGPAARVDPRGGQGRAVGRRPRHRRPGQRRAARHLRGGRRSRTARAIGASASSTPSTCARRTTPASRSWASSPRCSRTTPSTTAAGPRAASAAKRCASSYACRSLLDAGAKVAFGSDWSVAPLNPLLGIDAAVNRRTLDGKHPEGWFPEQKITVAEAVEAYTLTSAYAASRRRTAARWRPASWPTWWCCRATSSRRASATTSPRRRW